MTLTYVVVFLALAALYLAVALGDLRVKVAVLETKARKADGDILNAIAALADGLARLKPSPRPQAPVTVEPPPPAGPAPPRALLDFEMPPYVEPKTLTEKERKNATASATSANEIKQAQ